MKKEDLDSIVGIAGSVFVLGMVGYWMRTMTKSVMGESSGRGKFIPQNAPSEVKIIITAETGGYDVSAVDVSTDQKIRSAWAYDRNNALGKARILADYYRDYHGQPATIEWKDSLSNPQVKQPVTVECPICGKVIEIPDYNSITRSDALMRHFKKEHASQIGRLPQAMIEDGELIPWKDRHLVDPLPLPEFALSLLPAVQLEPGETKIDALLRSLKDGVERIQSSEEFRQYLLAMSRFHNYSWNNQLLILLQKPDATHVAGFNTWKDLGRWVKKGETGIAIFAPSFRAADVSWVRRADGKRWKIQHQGEQWGLLENGSLVGRYKTKREAERQLRAWGASEERVAEAEARFIVVHVFEKTSLV